MSAVLLRSVQLPKKRQQSNNYVRSVVEKVLEHCGSSKTSVTEVLVLHFRNSIHIWRYFKRKQHLLNNLLILRPKQ